MSITATVENDIIRVPADAHFPNGATVRIELIEPTAGVPAMRAWLATAVGAAKSGVTTDHIMQETRGEDGE